MNKNDQEFLVQKIRTQYIDREQTELEALKELDAKVKRPANVFSYVFGSIAAIVMGSSYQQRDITMCLRAVFLYPLLPNLHCLHHQDHSIG